MDRWRRRRVRSHDQFDWFSAYLGELGLQLLWRQAISGFTVVLAALPILMLYSRFGPAGPAGVKVSIVAAAMGVAGAILWLRRWPTRRLSIAYSLAMSAAIAMACLSLSNPYSSLMGCVTFAVLGGLIGYFHTVGYVATNLAVATACAAVASYRLISVTGDVALTIAALLTVAALNVGVPFGIYSLVHALRSDVRSSGRDPLTGLHNRRSFNHSVYELTMLADHGPGNHLVVTMIDLDDFKQLNDTHGHALGDQALISVSAALVDSVRPGAVIGRLGGEEFAIADVYTYARPVGVAERLRQSIASTPFQVTASIGTASVPLDTVGTEINAQQIGDLIRQADIAMYEAKRAGGNRIRHHLQEPERRHSEDVDRPDSASADGASGPL